MATKKKTAKNEDMGVVEVTKAVAKAYPKKQLLTAKRFQDNVDILHAILSDERLYTIEEVEQLLKKFLEREVK